MERWSGSVSRQLLRDSALHTAAMALVLRAGTWGYWTRVALAFAWAVTSTVLAAVVVGRMRRPTDPG
jgi:hypothetical protein